MTTPLENKRSINADSAGDGDGWKNEREEEPGMKERGYMGRIKSGGTLDVTAPNGSSAGKKGTVRITGTDLRSGGGTTSRKSK